MVDVIWQGIAAPHAVDLKKFVKDAQIKEFFPSGVENNTVNGRLVSINHGIETRRPLTVLFSTPLGKNSLIWASLTNFFRSTACGAAIPCQITSTIYTTTHTPFDHQHWR